MKLNQKGLTHHLLIVVLAVLVVGAAGFAGWRVYQGRHLDAHASTWAQKPELIKPIKRKNLEVLGGSYANLEYNTLTGTNNSSPMAISAKDVYTQGSSHSYDSSGDIYFVRSAYGSPTVDIMKAKRDGSKAITLKTFQSVDVSGVKLCVGVQYIAYLVKGPVGSNKVTAYAATKDLSQWRQVYTEIETKSLGGGVPAGISCGDRNFYTIAGSKLFRSPYNQQQSRPNRTSSSYTTVTVPNLEKIYDLSTSNYGFCGNQYQDETQIALQKTVVQESVGIELVNVANKTVTIIPKDTLADSYWFCSMSPDGTKVAHGKGVWVYDIASKQKIKLDTSVTPSYLVYGWRYGL